MSKKLRGPGNTITVLAPADVSSGAFVVVGGIGGVAINDAASGAEVDLDLLGVHELAAKGTDTPAAGAKAYWDSGNSYFTTTSSGNTLRGVFAAAKASGATTAPIRLDGKAV